VGKRNKGQETAAQTAEEKRAATELEEQVRHMRRMAEEAGAAGGKASIFRRDVVNGKPTSKERFLESVPTSLIWDSTYEYLAERWGGGAYRICLKDESGDFVPGAGRLNYEIEGAPKTADTQAEARKLDELEKRIVELTAPGANASSADMVRVLLDVTREQLRDLRNPPAAAVNGSPMEMAVNLVATLQAAQAPLLTALIERASAPAPDMLAQLQGLAQMMVTLRELAPQPSEASGWSRIADRLADPLGKLLDQHVVNQQTGAAPPSTMGQGTAMARPNADGQPAQGDPPWLRMIAPYLPQLLRYAAAGRDPHVVADFVAEEVPDAQLGMIYQTLTAPTFRDEFFAHVPDARTHDEWFGSFFSRLLEWIDPPTDETGTSLEDQAAELDGSKPEVGTVARDGSAP
jgi:hypothetical protein